MRRVLVLLAAVVLLAGGATAYATWAASSRQAGPAVAGFDTGEPGRVLVRSGGRVASVPLADPGAPPRVSSRACDRFYTANGTTLCLVTRPGPLPKTEALVLDRSLKETRRINLAGVPSRARVSASGRMASWTVFVTGDSYSTGGFSTWTGILDTRTGYLVTNMEDIPLYLDGRRYHSADVNYWGVTFAADDNRFYATVSTKGRTYLVEGDFGAWRARALRENAECPSLSPDGTRLVFKKRVSPGPWRLHLLDLATMRETPLGERASIDDQAAWLDDRTVMYAKDGDVWAADVGGGPPRRLIPGASSPAAVR
ncbi:TolB family protein [Nonomuraea sp. NPDC004702]